jgi:hypothetical protein
MFPRGLSQGSIFSTHREVIVLSKEAEPEF